MVGGCPEKDWTVVTSKSGVQTRYAKGMEVVDSKNIFSDTKDMI